MQRMLLALLLWATFSQLFDCFQSNRDRNKHIRSDADEIWNDFYRFMGIFHAHKAGLFYSFYGRYYMETKKDTVEQCLYPVPRQLLEPNKTLHPVSLRDDRENITNRLFKEPKESWMYVKNVRDKGFFILDGGWVFLLSSTKPGGLQMHVKNLPVENTFEGELRSCDFQTLLVEDRYIYCFRQKTYFLLTEIEEGRQSLKRNGETHSQDELFRSTWWPNQERVLMAIFDWKDGYFIFLCNDWMFVLQPFTALIPDELIP